MVSLTAKISKFLEFSVQQKRIDVRDLRAITGKFLKSFCYHQYYDLECFIVPTVIQELIVAEKDVTVLLTIIRALFACIHMFY